MSASARNDDGLSLDEDGFYVLDDSASAGVEDASGAGARNLGGVSDDTDPDFEVEVVDDRPAEDRVAPRDPSRAAAADDFADEAKDTEADQVLQLNRMKRLRYEWNEERRAKEAADRQREAAIQFAETVRTENLRLKNLLKSGEKVLVDEVRARTKSDVDQARVLLRRAMSDGDPEQVAAAQEALSRAVYDLRQAESYRIQEQEQEPEPAQRQPPQPVQPAQRTADPKFDAWWAKNPWFKRDQRMTDRAMEIHQRLVEKDGIFPVGDEYYKRIDTEMRREFPTAFNSEGGGSRQVSGSEGKAEPARKKTQSVVAPVSRNSGSSARKVQLTASQAQVAKRMGLTNEQYAMELVKLTRGDQNG